MKVEVVTPFEVLWSGEASSVVAPALEGDLGILPGRQPVLAILRPGHVRVTPAAGEQVSFEVYSGFLACDNDQIQIVVDNRGDLAEV